MDVRIEWVWDVAEVEYMSTLLRAKLVLLNEPIQVKCSKLCLHWRELVGVCDPGTASDRVQPH